MTRLLHLDASARPGRSGTHAHGSHTRRLTHHFVTNWLAARRDDPVTYRDVGATPPRPVSARWIRAAFTPAARRESWMHEMLAESDELIAEVVQADVLVLGVPMYNFSVPASFKAWIDNIVRIGETFDFDSQRPGDPYLPRLAERQRHVVLLSSRGGNGFEPGGPLAHMNHVEPSVSTAFEFIGISSIHCVAIEHEEEGGARLATSIDAAMTRVDRLVDQLIARLATESEASVA